MGGNLFPVSNYGKNIKGKGKGEQVELNFWIY
jgi:hypothetical protein